MRIDTHHHVIPPAFRTWAEEHGHGVGGGIMTHWPAWTAAEASAVMDSIDVQAGVASLPLPSDWLTDETTATKISRQVNDFFAELARDYPDRWGFFAYLPLPFLDAALAEATRTLDELGADGVFLMARSGDRYLGDPTYEPLFAELGRRGTVVLTHPQDLPGPVPDGVVSGITDFMLDTTRTGLSLVRSGTMRRYPDLKVILPHAGGFLPYIATRTQAILPPFSAPVSAESPTTTAALMGDLRRFYFDTAAPPSPYATPTLLAFADHSHLLFGTDYAILPATGLPWLMEAYENDPYLDDTLRAAIDRENALALFPNLATRLP